MKERLDQLRAMDSAAFMTLPASSFSPMPKETVVDPEEFAAVSSPYTNLNGHIPHAEGERRRKEMLQVATMLEERYRVLLPPDRVRRAQESVLSESASRSQVLSRDGDDSETDQASVIDENKLRLKLPARSSTSTTSASSPAATTPTFRKPRLNVSSKQSSVIRILRKAVPTPFSPPPALPHAEASPLSPSPTIDMDIPPSPEPEELQPPSPEPEELQFPPSSPLPTVTTVLPQTPISNEASLVELSSPDIPLSNGAENALRIASEQIYTFPEETSLFTPPGQEIPLPPEQEMPTAPSDQGMLIAPNGQERSSTPSDHGRSIIPESETAPISENQERSSHDQEMLPTPPEQERISTPEPERRASPEQDISLSRDQEELSSPSPSVPDRQPTPPLEREKSIPPEYRRSPTPLIRDRSISVIPEQEPPPEESTVTPERLPTPPTRERTTTPVPERLPTPPAPERLTTLAEVADLDGLPESGLSILEPPKVEGRELGKAEMEDESSVRAESEAPAPQIEPERVEVDVESEANKMDVEQDGLVGPIPTVAAIEIEQTAVADLTITAVPEETLIERTILPDVPQVSADSDQTVIVQAADVPVFEMGFNLDRPVTPEQMPQTELVDIEAPMPISSISVPRGRGRKRARLDLPIQNETVSAPVRGPRVPKNHVTFRGASGEMEVTASAIMKAAVHRTQRDVTRHLNAFGVPVPNFIVQMGPPFELPEWVFPPLSPAESEHAQGDFDVDIEDFELNPKMPTEQQVTPPAPTEPSEVDHTASIEVDRGVERAIVQSTEQSEPKIVISRLPPQLRHPEPEGDTVSLGDEDT